MTIAQCIYEQMKLPYARSDHWSIELSDVCYTDWQWRFRDLDRGISQPLLEISGIEPRTFYMQSICYIV